MTYRFSFHADKSCGGFSWKRFVNPLSGLFIAWLLAFACGSPACAQKTEPRIENIRMDFKDNRLEVEYDIAGSDSGQLHRIDFYVIDNIGNVVFPDSLKGDVGKDIPSGKDKHIIWDIYSEYDVVYGSFDPRIVLDGKSRYGMKGGPSNALLSVVMPGLGDYFVADHRKMKFKPWYRTAATYAFVGMGLAALVNREHIPPVMGEPGWYLEPIPVGDGHRIWTEVYRENWIKEPGYTEYWLFRYDAEFFMGVGLALWIYDIIWVAREGAKYKTVRDKIFNNITLVPSPEGMALCFTYHF